MFSIFNWNNPLDLWYLSAVLAADGLPFRPIDQIRTNTIDLFYNGFMDVRDYVYLPEHLSKIDDICSCHSLYPKNATQQPIFADNLCRF